MPKRNKSRTWLNITALTALTWCAVLAPQPPVAAQEATTRAKTPDPIGVRLAARRHDGLTIRSDGGVTFRVGGIHQSAGPGGCIRMQNATLNGIRYTTHSTVWQRRSGSSWQEVSGTRRSGGLCGWSGLSSANGTYRALVDLTIGSNRDEYYSNSLTVGSGGGNPTPPPPPDPTPEPPPPPPATGCTPTTTLLNFDGGYDVRMCYVTPDGTVGQAGAGVWASGKAGILWFFDRENAEVLVKVLDGCSYNGHRWAYVAPVTTLEFNLWITAPDGNRWTHSNRQGVTASTKSDDRAFQCSNEGNDGGGGDGGGGGGGGSASPDLVVSSPSVSNSSPGAGGSFTLRATVRNQGDASSGATTLRYYRSSNSTISTSDTQVGTDGVGALSASGSSAESISLTAPSSAGTYYYGACVDSVSGESSTGNNCSQGVRVTVAGGGGGAPGDALTVQLTQCSGSRSGSLVNVTMRGTIRANRRVTSVTVTGYANGRLIGTRSTSSISAGSSWGFSISGSFHDPTATRVECRAEARASVPARGQGSGRATATSPVLPISQE